MKLRKKRKSVRPKTKLKHNREDRNQGVISFHVENIRQEVRPAVTVKISTPSIASNGLVTGDGDTFTRREIETAGSIRSPGA